VETLVASHQVENSMAMAKIINIAILKKIIYFNLKYI
jgi:hypothetical protein